jgi:hypothetical protein
MIGALIIILAFFSLVMLLSPVKISVNSSRVREEIDGFFSFGWIMFLLRYTFKDKKAEIRVFGRRVVRLSNKEKSPEFKEQKESRPIKKSKMTPHSGDIFSLSGPMLRLFKDLIYSFRLKYLDIDIIFGLKDPSYTGIMVGFLHSIIGIMHKGHSIRWSADFTKPILEWNLKAEAAIKPIQIVLPVARFITDRQVLRSGLRIIRD